MRYSAEVVKLFDNFSLTTLPPGAAPRAAPLTIRTRLE